MPALKFTPGPWESGPCFERVRGNSFVILAHDGIKVAECWVDAPSNDREAEEATEADARLISAAPEMLEALAIFLESYDRGLISLPKTGLEIARAALKKAGAL